jgi:hypothetical protein
VGQATLLVLLYPSLDMFFDRMGTLRYLDSNYCSLVDILEQRF